MEKRVRVLVVDDSEEICELYQLILVPEGYEVRIAGDGERGFELLKSWRPDAVVLDVVMPKLDGLELLLKLRSDLAPPIPPVVLCSGFDLTEEEALRRGAVRFLRKPIEVEDLRTAVADALARRPANPQSLLRQWQQASAERQRALDEAGAIVAACETHGLSSLAVLAARTQEKVATLAAYLGVARAATALVRHGRLTVLGATEASGMGYGYDLGAALPVALEVLETGSTLLLPDAAAPPFDAVSRALGGARFFAGVPVVMDDDVPVGVACVFDPEARRIDADELTALYLFGRRGSDVLVRFAELGDADRLIRHGEGVVAGNLFAELLDAELRVLLRRGGSMELAVADVDDLGAVSAAIVGADARDRLIAGRVGPGRVALLKRAIDASARSTMEGVIASLRASDAVRELGIVDVRGLGATGLSGAHLLHLASGALDRAIERGTAPQRVVIDGTAGP